MDDLDTPQIDAEASDLFSLIDVSASDDDFLFASSSEANIVDKPGGNFADGVPINQSSDTLALHGSRKTGKCNLRKSLAWDSAFFTNAGVLDPEELSSIIEGAETSLKQNHFLPGIQEEVSKSIDSVSTFQSDNLTLESLEADLFSDIRVSIQRCSKSSTTGKSHGSKIHHEEDSTNKCSTKIGEPPSRKMAKPKSASNKLDCGVQGPMRTLKPVSVRKQETKPPVNRSRDPSSLLSRPLKAAGEPSSQVAATTKRMSVGANRAKLDANAVGNMKGGAGKGASLPEASHQVNLRKPLPKAPVLSKISAASSVMNRTTTHSSRSSCDSSSSSASENVRKSQTSAIRRKMDKNVSLPSGSKTKTPSKVVEKVRSQNKESRLSAYLKSTTKVSSSISPASSISEWSTESSSSMATVNQKHFGFNPCPSSSQDVTVDSSVSRTLHSRSSDRVLGSHDNQVPGIFSQSAKQQTSTESVVSNTRPGSAKPSGLRLPSPNIGFFDGVKVGTRTPSSSSRSRSALPSSLPRSVAGTHSPSGTTNKIKLATSASKMTAAIAGTAKPRQRTADAKLKTPARFLDPSVDLPKPSSAKHIVNDSEASSELLRSSSPESALEGNKKVSEACDIGKDVLDSGLVYGDKSTSDPVAIDSVETSSEFLKSISRQSALGRNEDTPEAFDPHKQVSDLVYVTIEDGPKTDPQSLEAHLKSWIQDNSVDVKYPLSECPESNLSQSVLEVDSEVARVTDGGKQVLELASVAIGNLVASENEASSEGKLLITLDLNNDASKDDPQRIASNVTPIAQLQGCAADLQGTSRAKNDIESGTTSELSYSTSPLERYSEVDDEEKLALPELCSVVKDDLIAPETGLSHSTNDLVTATSQDGSNNLDTTDCDKIICASPCSNMEERDDRSNISTLYNLTPSQQVDETDNLEIISHETQQHDGERIIGHSAANESQHLEIVLVEIKDDAYAENQEEGSNTNVDSREHKGEMQEEPERNLQSDAMLLDKLTSTILSYFEEPSHQKQNESTQSVSQISCSPPLPLGVGSPPRTPFTIKNTISNVVEVCNAATISTTEAFLKVDVVPLLEKSQKENS